MTGFKFDFDVDLSHFYFFLSLSNFQLRYMNILRDHVFGLSHSVSGSPVHVLSPSTGGLSKGNLRKISRQSESAPSSHLLANMEIQLSFMPQSRIIFT